VGESSRKPAQRCSAEAKAIVRERRRVSKSLRGAETAQRCSAVGESDRERGAESLRVFEAPRFEIAKLCRGQKPARDDAARLSAKALP
jgi:hypothetical protein